MPRDGKLIVASCRLPVTLTRKASGWETTESAGGLATALRSVAERRSFEWIGWAGTYVPQPDRAAITRQLAASGTRPIFINKTDADGFYAGFSNRVLWPLFHGLTDLSSYDGAGWKAYTRVNAMFADEIARRAKPSDIIWVHDYQLCLVPELLRQRGVSCPVGFFLHIPFPSSEIYRTLPVREDVLRGLLGADFVAFHAYEYVSHFRKSCLRVLGVESDPNTVRTAARRVHLGVLPIGIEPNEIQEMSMTEEALGELNALQMAYRGKKIVLGVDRLDYTKGIPEKLLAFEELLRTTPKWRDKCVLIQVAAPSRESVDEYQALKRRVDELVGRINGRFATPHHSPIVYINQSIPRTRLVGMYQAADIALVTPVRDGMNLVALEYIAARGDQGGRLVLSEFAGAAYLMPGARLVNPYNVAEVAQVLGEELEHRHHDSSHMLEFVHENTSISWAKRFLDMLETKTSDERTEARVLKVDTPQFRKRLASPNKNLILLDYDGTLRGYERKPLDAVPTQKVRSVLAELARHAILYVISGRPADVLEKWLGDLPIGLVCEHGYAIRTESGEWHKNASGSLGVPKRVDNLLEEFRRRTPGATVERKRSAIAWHYRSADPEFGTFQANELLNQLEDVLRRRPYGVLRGNRVIEVRHTSCTKGRAAEELLERHSSVEFVFCAGDDRTDEDMMDAIRQRWKGESALCWVGGRNSGAEFWTESPKTLLAELTVLAELLSRQNGKRSRSSGNGKRAPARARASEAKVPSERASRSAASNRSTRRSRTTKSNRRSRSGPHRNA